MQIFAFFVIKVYLCENFILMIARKIYLQKLRLLKDQDLIKVITGVRRCGKSTLLEAFRNELLSSGVHPKYLLTFDYDNVIIEGIQKKNVIDWLLEK